MKVIDMCKLIFATLISVLSLLTLVRHVDYRLIVGAGALFCFLYVYEFILKVLKVEC